MGRQQIRPDSGRPHEGHMRVGCGSKSGARQPDLAAPLKPVGPGPAPSLLTRLLGGFCGPRGFFGPPPLGAEPPGLLEEPPSLSASRRARGSAFSSSPSCRNALERTFASNSHSSGISGRCTNSRARSGLRRAPRAHSQSCRTRFGVPALTKSHLPRRPPSQDAKHSEYRPRGCPAPVTRVGEGRPDRSPPGSHGRRGWTP